MKNLIIKNKEMKKRPLIGITGSKSGSQFGVGDNHLEFVDNFGNASIIMPHETEKDLKRYDLVYMPGGMDLNPLHYKSKPSFKSSNIDVFKEHFYNTHLPILVANKIPIFGVCLGAQSLAAYFGATLTKHMAFHEQSPDRWEIAHEVWPTEECLMYNGQMMKVNSHHHQAITQSDLANAKDNIIPLFMAINNDKNKSKKQGEIIEAFKVKDFPIFAVQWHPEELYDVFSVDIMERLANGWDGLDSLPIGLLTKKELEELPIAFK